MFAIRFFRLKKYRVKGAAEVLLHLNILVRQIQIEKVFKRNLNFYCPGQLGMLGRISLLAKQ